MSPWLLLKSIQPFHSKLLQLFVLEGILFHSRYSNVLELFQVERGKNTFHLNQGEPIKRRFLLPRQQHQVQQLRQPHHEP